MSPSIWQILIVLVIVLIIFGPKRIPGLGKSMGEAIRGFKKGLNEDEIDVTESAKKEKIESGEETPTASKESEKSESHTS